MKIVKDNEYQMKMPRLDCITAGTAFEYEGDIYIKVVGDEYGWNAVNLDDGSRASFSYTRRVRPIDAEVVVK